VIERGVLLSKGTEIDVKDLPTSLTTAASTPSRTSVGEDASIDAIEMEHIRRVLASSATLEDAARTLGIDSSTLYRKRKKYGL
jgi:NtrC-family two-component system response regulator AlgB